MAECRISPAAQAELGLIFDYSLAAFGLEVARDYLDAFDDAFLRLAEFPESGAFFPGSKPPTRYLICGSHRIFYDYDGVAVEVQRILHQAMRAPGGKR